MSERATFDDYKRRLNGGNPDMWQLHDEWWHVIAPAVMHPLRQRQARQPAQIIDLAGGSCVIAPWSLPE